jgi:hypothetical protein
MTQSRAWVGDVLRSALLPHCPYSYGEKRPGVPRVLLCKAEMQLKIYQESDPGTNPSSLLYLWRSSLAKWLWWLTLSETVRRDKRDSVHCSEFSLEIQTWADIWALCCLEQGVDRGTWALWVIAAPVKAHQPNHLAPSWDGIRNLRWVCCHYDSEKGTPG